MRRPCFIEEDDGLASIASPEAGSSVAHNPFFARAKKSYSYRSLSSLSSTPSAASSPRSMRFYEARCKEMQQPHFLETCFLCKKHIGDNRDIFMYRGDTPFCSEECREEQIEMDEAKEKNIKFTSSLRKIRKENQNKSNTKNYQLRANTVAAA